MLKDNLTKITTNLAILGLLVVYPLLLCVALLHALHRIFFGKRETINISNDVALITGGAHGLGRAIAEVLAEKGCRICIVDINIELGEQTAKEIAEQYGVKTKAYKTDIAAYDQLVTLHEQINYDFGKVTILVNNAGIMEFKKVFDPEPEEVQRMIAVNFTSHYFLNHIFLADMKKQRRGYILATSSLAAVLPAPFNEVYAGTKYGTRGHMRTLRQNLLIEGYDNIICTTLMPYFLKTNENVMNLAVSVNSKKLYPFLSAAEVAQRAVNGMLSREAEICMPACMGLLYRLDELLPSEFRLLTVNFIVKVSGVGAKSLQHRNTSKTK